MHLRLQGWKGSSWNTANVAILDTMSVIIVNEGLVHMIPLGIGMTDLLIAAHFMDDIPAMMKDDDVTLRALPNLNTGSNLAETTKVLILKGPAIPIKAMLMHPHPLNSAMKSRYSETMIPIEDVCCMTQHQINSLMIRK
jgi:hypothetical protein